MFITAALSLVVYPIYSLSERVTPINYDNCMRYTWIATHYKILSYFTRTVDQVLKAQQLKHPYEPISSTRGRNRRTLVPTQFHTSEHPYQVDKTCRCDDYS